VSVPVPPAPCFTLDGTSVDFGTLSFSDPAAAETPLESASPAIRVTSCSSAAERITGAASNATFAVVGRFWEAMDSNTANTCDVATGGGVDLYAPFWHRPGGQGRLYNPRPDGSFVGTGFQLAAGAGGDITYQLKMPCRGSVGAGGTASITFYLLAVLV
jgi:hypothetical protein